MGIQFDRLIKSLPLKRRNHIGYQVHDFFNARIGRFFLKLYCSIISGVWSIVLLLPLEGFLSYEFGADPFRHYTTKRYFMFLGLFTVFFVISSALLPTIKHFHVKRILKNSLTKLPLTPCQRINFFRDKAERHGFKAFFTAKGLLTFLRYNVIKNIEYTSLYFCLESLIHAFDIKSRGGFYVSACFLVLYGITYFVSDIVARKMSAFDSTDSDVEALDPELRKELIIRSVAEMLDADGLGSSQISSVRENVQRVVEMIEINLMCKGADQGLDSSRIQASEVRKRLRRLAVRGGV